MARQKVAATKVKAPGHQSDITEEVRALYTAYPYPDPVTLRSRPVTSVLEYIRHLFWPGRPLSGLRILDAGCGIGGATLPLAQHYPDVHVVGIDLSETSLEFARKEAKRRRIGDNLELRKMSIEDAAGLDGPFDYIISSGVLHHLDDPVLGLRQLASVLAPDGGMSIMLYGTHGRHSVYIMQDLFRLLGKSKGLAERVDMAREVLGRLPPNQPFKPNEWADLNWESNVGLVDLLLHVRDRSYTVPEIYDFVAAAGLRLDQFMHQSAYRPETYTESPALRELFGGLDEFERATAAELLNGKMRRHEFFVTHQDHRPVRFRPEGVLLMASRLRRTPLIAWENVKHPKGSAGLSSSVTEHFDYYQRTYTLTNWILTALGYCDGTRTGQEIFEIPAVKRLIPGGTNDAKWERYGAVLEVLAADDVVLCEL